MWPRLDGGWPRPKWHEMHRPEWHSVGAAVPTGTSALILCDNGGNLEGEAHEGAHRALMLLLTYPNIRRRDGIG